MAATLHLGDCLDVMAAMDAGSVDLILADLPYGTTACKWDTVIPFAPLWEAYRRLLKPRGAVVLTASQPFTSMLVMSNPGWFKYELAWDKKTCTGHGAAKYRPMMAHESVLVFAPSVTTYLPQMERRTDLELNRLSHKSVTRPSVSDHAGGLKTRKSANRYEHVMKFPSSVIRVVGVTNRSNEKTNHPTQKPVALGSYLIRTYTNPGETVLDNTMGSGTFGVSAVETGRQFIGIESDPGYFATAEARIRAAESTPCPPASPLAPASTTTSRPSSGSPRPTSRPRARST